MFLVERKVIKNENVFVENCVPDSPKLLYRCRYGTGLHHNLNRARFGLCLGAKMAREDVVPGSEAQLSTNGSRH